MVSCTYRPKGVVTVSKPTSLAVSRDTFTEFNRLKIRIASEANRIPPVSSLIAALIVIGNNHYDELITEVTKEPESES